MLQAIFESKSIQTLQKVKLSPCYIGSQQLCENLAMVISKGINLERIEISGQKRFQNALYEGEWDRSIKVQVSAINL